MIKLAKQKEDSELLQLVKWFELQYPNESKYLKVNYDRYEPKPHIAKLQKDMHIRLDNWPDIQLPIPKGIYLGMFIEFKRTGTKILTKKQKYYSPHLKSQSQYLTDLCNSGYYAVFGVGFDDTIKIINNYMNLGDYEFKKI
jgi:hypothetical protein